MSGSVVSTLTTEPWRPQWGAPVQDQWQVLCPAPGI